MGSRKTHSCGPFVLMGLLVAAACGAPDTRARDAANAEYRIRRDVLWAEIIDVLRTRFPNMEIASLDADRLVTQWMDTHWRDQAVVPMGGLRGRVAEVPLYRRVIVKVSGLNPYRVSVDVETGTWQRGAVPTSNGRAAEASDRLKLEIHERLKVREHAP